MPLLKMQVSVEVPLERQAGLMQAASKILAEVTHKPEAYVMVTLEQAAACMAGKAGPAAFLDVRGIGGFNKTVNGDVTARLCELLHRELRIDPACVYATFTDVPAVNWGWKGQTFG